MSGVTPVEMKLVQRLHRTVEGLPERLRTREFHALSEVLQARHLELKFDLLEDHALLVASERYLARPWLLNARLRWNRHKIFREQRANVLNLKRLLALPQQRSQASEPAGEPLSHLHSDLIELLGEGALKTRGWLRIPGKLTSQRLLRILILVANLIGVRFEWHRAFAKQRVEQQI